MIVGGLDVNLYEKTNPPHLISNIFYETLGGSGVENLSPEIILRQIIFHQADASLLLESKIQSDTAYQV